MCWSAPVSLAIGAAGLGVAAYGHKKGESKYITLPLAFFSLMELLQFAGYLYIDQCALGANNWLTLISYVHIAFQPIFINMYLMYSLPRRPSKRVRQYIYAACLAVTTLLLIKLVPFAPDTLCKIGQTLCGPQMCTVSGTWHIGWSVPLYNFPIPGDAFIYYALVCMLLPLFYGAWYATALYVLTGPFLAYYLASGNPLEWPAIWCFYSVILIIITMFNHMYRKRHYFRAFFRIHK